jgi:2-keto-4-pentenoate hydratase/2-oxohepta-3-ene-1,7-dioic acid hydratase in catechol pathway
MRPRSDEIGDPLDLRLRTYVNGDRRQDGNTKHMLLVRKWQ